MNETVELREKTETPAPEGSFEAKAVRFLAYADGISLLVLFFAAMPAKYLLAQPMGVKVVGPIHGMLFLLYIAAVVMWRPVLNWTWGRVLAASLASCVPFALFLRRFHEPSPAKE